MHMWLAAFELRGSVRPTESTGTDRADHLAGAHAIALAHKHVFQMPDQHLGTVGQA